jgi:hypothetical protein
VLFLLTILDAVISQFRAPLNVFHLRAGGVVEINGQLEENVTGTDQLSYTSSSEHLRLTFRGVHAGFWFGGQMWRGELLVSPDIAPGKYQLTINSPISVSPKPANIFRIVVHPDSASYRRSHRSLIQRQTGASPWWVAIALVPLIGMAFGTVWLLSRRRDALLAERGMADIYWVKTGEAGYEIAFGLGARDRLQPGSRITVLNEKGWPVGTAEVRETSETDAVALVGWECAVKPGYLVGRD